MIHELTFGKVAAIIYLKIGGNCFFRPLLTSLRPSPSPKSKLSSKKGKRNLASWLPLKFFDLANFSD